MQLKIGKDGKMIPKTRMNSRTCGDESKIPIETEIMIAKTLAITHSRGPEQIFGKATKVNWGAGGRFMAPSNCA